MKIPFCIFLACLNLLHGQAQYIAHNAGLKDECGAIFRADTNSKVIYLMFTAHDFADGKDSIIPILERNKVKASFFFTGDFYRHFPDIIARLKANGHYLGAHSNKHLLYCDWIHRDSMLVSDEEIIKDLRANYHEMRKFGIKKKDAVYFMPPYEWYNRHVVKLIESKGFTVVNFTPGTSSNADYTTPEMANYQDSKTILQKIYDYELNQPNGLNGFHLLIHFGCDAARTDKLYFYLDELIRNLKIKGYHFDRLW
ncbi:MAG: polysaccharide deacetylase family protein [Bacteroidales bacterium]